MKKTVEIFENYLPELTRKDDFDDFWRAELSKSSEVPLNAEFTKREYILEDIQAYDLWYDGVDGTRVEGLYVKPAWADKDHKVPLICKFHGYSGDCGVPADNIQEAGMGYSVLSLSCRNQGGHTFDRAEYHSGIESNVTHGILDPEEYYYKWVICQVFAILFDILYILIQ